MNYRVRKQVKKEIRHIDDGDKMNDKEKKKE